MKHVMDSFKRDELDDSEEDTVTDYSQINAITNDIYNIDSTDFVLRTMPSSTLVPTISVTPHSSPGRNYPILGIIILNTVQCIIWNALGFYVFNWCTYKLLFIEENIQQLHEIHDVIQQMRDSASLGLTQVTYL